MLEREIAMGMFLSGFVLPMLLFTAAVLNWSLISVGDLLAFLIVQYNAPKVGLRSRRRYLVSWCTLIVSFSTILLNALFHFIRAINGDGVNDSDAEWLEKIGFIGIRSWKFSNVKWYLLVQALKVIFSTIEIKWENFGLDNYTDSSLRCLCSTLKYLGCHLRVLCYLLLPAIQLAVGISRPSWASLPFFICSSLGIINWSLTSNFLGLYQWSQYLLLYAGFNIILLYLYQLPFALNNTVDTIAGFLGYYKLNAQSEWSELLSGVSLLLIFITLSWIRCELREMNYIMSTKRTSLTEQLLPPKHSFFIRESRSGVRHTNVLLRQTVFRTFCINFFAYGFPISLLALSFWSFHFASICAFGLLAYVGYILYAFPSLFHLHHLNGLLLVFILLWAASTYIFNIAFAVLTKEVSKDMQIWETIGLWHYPIPGFYLLAQFCLGVLISLVNLVNNSVFVYLSDEDIRLSRQNSPEPISDGEETKILIVATVAWGLRKVSRAIGLVLISLVAIKPGFIHSIYMIFFLMFLLNRTIGRKMHQSLILLCETHFALLYVLRLKVVSNILEQRASYARELLFQLGFVEHATTKDLLKIASVACFCAFQNHGFHILSSFSAILQHTPCAPVGFGILKAGLIKSVFLSVYTLQRNDAALHERKVATYLRAVSHKFLTMYRSCGTYVACLTIIFSVYIETPNLMSFGYMFFVLMWLSGRQVHGKTKKRLWVPLKVYSIFAFCSIYVLSVFSIYRAWLSEKVDVSSVFGYDEESSIWENIWESLAVLIFMQLYSYERVKSKYYNPSASDETRVDALSFLQRLSIIHCDKFVCVAVLYASVSPISATGLVYVAALMATSGLPKSSWIPSRTFLIYSGFLLLVEYLFQLWGGYLEMFPGQRFYTFSILIGLRKHSPSFFGMEEGFRGKMVVVGACLFQYNVFFWLKKTTTGGVRGKWEELCDLFVLEDDAGVGVCVSSGDRQFKRHGKRLHVLRRERLRMQMTYVRLHVRFWAENMFNVFGLEINMLALLLTSFALLNFVSLIYITSLAACIILPRPTLRKFWHLLVFLLGSIFILEYFAIWMDFASFRQWDYSTSPGFCTVCWKSSDQFFEYCKNCWFGIILDDPRMLLSYYAVFALASFKLRADRSSSQSASYRYKKMLSQYKRASLDDLSTKTKVLWTCLDYLRLYTFCHLLDLVLSLILITGTLEFDILHLGYLGFALLFFRIRLQILKDKNRIFKYLRMYNFALIVLSLAYQSPYVGSACEDECPLVSHVSKVVGFYKYDYGFRITSRSALVEIVIYVLVSLQSYMFSSEEFDYVSEYIEAEQIDTYVREQEKKAAWRTAQLQEIRRSEEEKRRRNLQVEKMKSEMLDFQTKLHSMSIGADIEDVPSVPFLKQQSLQGSELTMSSFDDKRRENPTDRKRNPIASAVHLVSDGVSEARFLCKMGVTNVVKFFNIKRELSESAYDYSSSDDDVYYEIDNTSMTVECERTASVLSDSDRVVSESSYQQMGMILRYIWAQMRSNNDIVCYCSFVLVFLWNFSLFSMVYLAVLFLYALCINTGPKNFFWVLMLVYSEMCISALYIYQIVIQQCGISLTSSWLPKLGFPKSRIRSSFVINNWPLFLVYLFVLLQTSITARDNKWTRGKTLYSAVGSLRKYWKSLTEGAETPPYFVQVSMKVDPWPEDGIQPEKVKAGINNLLRVHHVRTRSSGTPSSVRVQSIDRSPDDESVALVVFEALNVKSLTPAADVATEILNGQRAGIPFPYPILSVIGGGKRDVDLYAFIFCADLAVFFLVSAFYQSVMKNKTEFLEVYQEDQFPKEFVFILMVIFFLIVLDRIIYLCSFAIGKVFFYLFNLFLFTYMVIWYAWYIDEQRRHAGKFALRAIYVTKAVSLALQAVQIRYGLPHESTLYRQLLTSSISKVNYIGFRMYRALPFLYELRCVLDWSCTTTSLTMYDWLKLEDMHSSLFLVKCDAILNRAKHKQGEKQTKLTKFCNGICLFFVLICVIWAPMLMYSSGNPTNIANPIKDATVKIDLKTLSGRVTLFETTLCERIPWDELEEKANVDPYGYLTTSNSKDTQLICCQSDASKLWLTPPSVMALYMKSIPFGVSMFFSWQLTRDRPKGKEVVKYEVTVGESDLPLPWDVVDVLNGTSDAFVVGNIYPRFFRVTGSGDVRALEQSVEGVSGLLVMNRGSLQWWSFFDVDVGSGCRGPMAVIVSEETPQGILGDTLSKFSIWGLYITFVLAVGRFIRLQCSDLRMRIPFENLPSCDRLIAICEDIYAARANGELEVEEILYWILVKIYRTPHMLLEYTKPD